MSSPPPRPAGAQARRTPAYAPGRLADHGPVQCFQRGDQLRWAGRLPVGHYRRSRADQGSLLCPAGRCLKDQPGQDPQRGHALPQTQDRRPRLAGDARRRTTTQLPRHRRPPSRLTTHRGTLAFPKLVEASPAAAGHLTAQRTEHHAQLLLGALVRRRGQTNPLPSLTISGTRRKASQRPAMCMVCVRGTRL